MHLFHLLPRFVPSFISLYLTSNPSSTLTPPASLPHCRLLDIKYMKRKACQRRAFIGKHKTLHSKHHDAKQQERHGQKATEQIRTPRPSNPDLNPKSTKLHTQTTLSCSIQDPSSTGHEHLTITSNTIRTSNTLRAWCTLHPLALVVLIVTVVATLHIRWCNNGGSEA